MKMISISDKVLVSKILSCCNLEKNNCDYGCIRPGVVEATTLPQSVTLGEVIVQNSMYRCMLMYVQCAQVYNDVQCVQATCVIAL